MFVAVASALWQGYSEQRAENARRARKIELDGVPVRARLVLTLDTSAESAMRLCRDFLQREMKVRRVAIDQPLRVAVVTGPPFFGGDQLTVESKAVSASRCSLEISSVPRLPTVQMDRGDNYTNVFLLGKYLKEHLAPNEFIDEKLIDLDQVG
jgi:hypothetical protein